MPTFTEMQERLSSGSRWDFSDPSAVYINCNRTTISLNALDPNTGRAGRLGSDPGQETKDEHRPSTVHSIHLGPKGPHLRPRGDQVNPRTRPGPLSVTVSVRHP